MRASYLCRHDRAPPFEERLRFARPYPAIHVVVTDLTQDQDPMHDQTPVIGRQRGRAAKRRKYAKEGIVPANRTSVTASRNAILY
jgi:hypothetical protein